MAIDKVYYAMSGLVVGLLIGFLSGYYVGVAESNERAAGVVPVTPASQVEGPGINTLGDIETNPYEGVKLNPFE